MISLCQFDHLSVIYKIMHLCATIYANYSYKIQSTCIFNQIVDKSKKLMATNVIKLSNYIVIKSNSLIISMNLSSLKGLVKMTAN